MHTTHSEEVLSCTGGQESEASAVANVLVPALKPFHCSGPGVGHTLKLRCTKACHVSHVVLYGAAGCTEPLRAGTVEFGGVVRRGRRGSAARLSFL
jgi:hypothetical protein